MAKARPYKYMNRERGHAILVRATWPTTTEQHARRRLSRPTCATMDFSGLLGHPQLSYQYGHLAPAAWQSDIVMYSACIFRLCTYFCFFSLAVFVILFSLCLHNDGARAQSRSSASRYKRAIVTNTCPSRATWGEVSFRVRGKTIRRQQPGDGRGHSGPCHIAGHHRAANARALVSPSLCAAIDVGGLQEHPQLSYQEGHRVPDAATLSWVL